MQCPDSCANQQSASGAQGQAQAQSGQGAPSRFGYQAQSQYGQSNQSRFGYQAQSGYGSQAQSGYGSQAQSGYGSQAQSGYGYQAQSQSGQVRQPGFGYQSQCPSGQSRQPGFGYQAQSQYSQQRQPGFGYQAQAQYGQQTYQQQSQTVTQSTGQVQVTEAQASGQATQETTKIEDKTKTKTKKPGDKKGPGFQLPALSIVGTKKEINFEEIRKKVVRRGAPVGEDKKQMAKILKHLRECKTKIMVHEFVSLIAKFTCDNGEVMRKVMEEDLAAFRKTVTKVYENMTQDVSDVLVNEQIQTTNFYQERHDMYNNKMLWMISEIFQMVPEFDFERYEKEKEDFLKHVCPLPQLTIKDAEELELQKRQEAFHRLQWLKIEEGRLAEENRRLELRLEELKIQHTREQTQSTMKSTIMEDRLQVLEVEEQEKERKLKELEQLLGKNIVRTEAFLRLEEDEAIRMTKVNVEEQRKSTQLRHEKSEWASHTAVDIEQQAAYQLHVAESSRAQERKRYRKRERETYKESSLFGGSLQCDELGELSTASNLQEKTIQETTTTTQERRPRSPRGRPCPGQCQ